ncbi:MAG: tetratricopeptide repeat protein [Mycobacterium sp.]
MNCGEPGCGGTVVDGYCEVCGTAPMVGSHEMPTMAAPGQSTARSAPSASTARSAPSSTTGRSVRTGRTGSSSRSSSSRGRLGAGIVAIPPVPKGDPAAAIMPDPKVAEGSRFCGNSSCGKPVGRGRDGKPGLETGFCTQCGTRYSFVPRLSRGDLVSGQYEVQGCLAHGGLGWIYLAVDRNVHNRWVVLKGLLNSGDADAMAAAAAETLALAEVEHPTIVRIYNFVQHPDPAGVPVGYIVMEFVGGTSLKQIRKARNGPLPADQAVAYMIEIAPALGYLHAQGLAYCDFKPDNVMQTDEQLKLIDLGAVIKMDDQESAIYGTVGYQAPEIAHTGPTVAGDVYTVGRTLAVLVADLPQRNGRFDDELPTPATVPVFARYESLYLAIRRATDPDPAQRFSSMAELTDQLTGVLYEIAAADGRSVQPRMSSFFSPQRSAYGPGPETPTKAANAIAALPVPMVDPSDPGAALLATTSGTPAAQLEHVLYVARGGENHGKSSSLEVPLRLVRAALEIGSAKDAWTRLTELEGLIPGDWRLTWYRAQCGLLEGELEVAEQDFGAVLASLPGELGPKFALAVTAELRGVREVAQHYYDTVWRTDNTFVSAAFGLARQRAAAGDRLGAVAALGQVPPGSALHTTAGATAIEFLLEGRAAAELDEPTLLDAGNRAGVLTVESASKRAAIRQSVLQAALGWLRAGNTPQAQRLLGHGFDETGVRLGLEGCYRELAHDTTDLWERIALVEKANTTRPRTRV